MKNQATHKGKTRKTQGEDEEEGGEVDANSSRIGSTQWCICEGCEAMPTADECFCCQELEELNQKFDESGLIFLRLYLFECSVVKQRNGEVFSFCRVFMFLNAVSIA